MATQSAVKTLGLLKNVATKETWCNGSSSFHLSKARQDGTQGHYIMVRINGNTKCIFKSKGLQQTNASLSVAEFGDNPVISGEYEGREWFKITRAQRELTPDSCPF